MKSKEERFINILTYYLEIDYLLMSLEKKRALSKNNTTLDLRLILSVKSWHRNIVAK
jgi:hypothetical protein